MHLLDAGGIILGVLLSFVCIAQSWIGEYYQESFVFSTAVLSAFSISKVIFGFITQFVSLDGWHYTLVRLAISGSLVFLISWLCHYSYRATQCVSTVSGFAFGLTNIFLYILPSMGGLLWLVFVGSAAVGGVLVRSIESPAVLIGSALLGSDYFAGLWNVRLAYWLTPESQDVYHLIGIYERRLFYGFLTVSFIVQACLKNFKKHDRSDLKDVLPAEFIRTSPHIKADV